MDFKKAKGLAYDAFVSYGFQKEAGKLLRKTNSTMECVHAYKSRFTEEMFIDAKIWYLRFGEPDLKLGALDFHVSVRVSRCAPLVTIGETTGISLISLSTIDSPKPLMDAIATQVERELFIPARDERNLANIRRQVWASSGYYAPFLG